MLDGFKNIVCLSLNNRGDRRNRTKGELGKAGIEFKFFNANKGGAAGFCMSMFNLFQNHHGNTFVFEDDVKFIANPELIDIAYSELPDDWDLFYLGANVRQPIKRYSKHLLKLENAWTSHAIGYSAKAMDFMRANWDGRLRNGLIFDEWLRVEVQNKLKCFITDPMICTQYNDFSDIQKKDVNYDIIKESQKYYEAIS